MKKEPYQIAFIGGGINSAIGEVHKAASQMDGHFELVAGAFSTHAETNSETARTWASLPTAPTQTTANSCKPKRASSTQSLCSHRQTITRTS